MNKIKKISLRFLAGSSLFVPLAVFGLGNISKQQIVSPSSSLRGIDWVRKCIEQYPEICWLADANVRKTEEGQGVAQGSYSEQIFGQKFVEFDRTIMTLHGSSFGAWRHGKKRKGKSYL